MLSTMSNSSISLEFVKMQTEFKRLQIDRSKTKKNHRVFNSRNADPERLSIGFQDSHNTYCYYCLYIPLKLFNSYRGIRA